MNIYVGNLSYDLTEGDLKTAFQAHGEVESVNIIVDRNTGRAKGFGFVEMPEKEQGLAAIEALNGKELAGREIVVNEARPKAPKTGGHRGGFGGGRNRY
jgi:RNA recognition motif-containing protein